MKKYINLLLCIIILMVGQFVEVKKVATEEYAEAIYGGYYLGEDEEHFHIRCIYYVAFGRLTNIGGQEIWIEKPVIIINPKEQL